jgi:glycosyltransferase involved in cell wall biosynthesis
VKPVSVTAVVAAYNAERYIGETVEAILGQTRPPDEVVVVNDGSTDGTAEELRRFGADVRVIDQANASAAGAYNRGFAEARGDYIARCDADDIWQPDKLERQLAAVAEHPRIDIAIGGAWIFGREDRLFAPAPGDGLLEHDAFTRRMYDWNVVCSATALIRRELAERLGPLIVGLVCEDYDYWLRALQARAVFYYDPAILVRYRQHDTNVTNNVLKMARATHETHVRFTDLPGDPGLVRRVLARDLATIGRLLVDEDPRQARAAFAASVRTRPSAGAAAWTALLAVPATVRPSAIDASLRVTRRARRAAQ